uniref:Uncharacterized protein n=1 Tax=Nicotiana tabacum TaxID=4097 RepID=A0A1S3YCX3_TOBAC|nr:PREDICTED: uncharacterized protein LOC107774839 [Nicotiana tabacum]
MDISGEQHLDIRHDIIKKRIDVHGNVIETRKEGIGAPKIDRPLQKHGGGLEHNETYYGSCYGAEGSDDEAYRKKGWALSNLDIFDQLILEVGVEIGSFKTSLETSLRSKASYVTNKAIKKGRDPTPSEIHLHIHTHGNDENHLMLQEKIRKEEYMVLDLKKNTTMGRIFMTLLDLMQHPQQHL